MVADAPWSSHEQLMRLSRRQFGRRRMRRVGVKLREAVDGLCNQHRDYCGHGLLFRGGVYYLLEVHDGYMDLVSSRIVSTWTDEDAFVAFWTAQSDFTCAGADVRQNIFYTADPWQRNNQRITRERLDAFLVSAK